MHTTLDQLRDAYVELYEEAEAISKSSVVAARLAPGARLQAEVEKPSLVDRVPHDVRAKIPPVRAPRRAQGAGPGAG